MKIAKKIVVLLLITVLLFALPACKEEPQSTHLDWVYIPNPTNTGALTAEGYYSWQNGVLCYADIATENSVVLCQKPGCKHVQGLEDEERCDAELELNARYMLFENDRLYYADDQSTLWSRNATGGELTELGILAKEFIEDRKSVTFANLSAICNGYLYYSGSIVEMEDGVASGGDSVGYYIGRFNIAQRKEEILVHQEVKNYGEDILLIAARETGILYLYQEGLDSTQDWEDLTKRREAMKTMPVQIRHLDLTTGQTTTLISTTYSECQKIHTVENGKLYYAGNTLTHPGIRSYDLANGKDTVFYDGELSSAFFGKGYWRRTKWLDPQGKTAEFTIYDANTGKTYPCELSGHFGTINQSAHGMVMYYDDHSTVRGYFFLSYDSLVDGLQESDLKLLYNIVSGGTTGG